MEKIVKALREALKNHTTESGVPNAASLAGKLVGTPYVWISDLPISIVHRREKVKDAEAADWLQEQGFFDEEGCSHAAWERGALTELCSGGKSAFQTLDLAVASDAAGLGDLVFRNKRPNDYWKRLQNVGAIEAMVGLQYAGGGCCSDKEIARQVEESANGQWGIESDLRDAIRSKKENSGLREKPFVWIVIKAEEGEEATDHIALLLHHYFGDNVVKGRGESDFYIGYSDTLNEISLREFYKKA